MNLRDRLRRLASLPGETACGAGPASGSTPDAGSPVWACGRPLVAGEEVCRDEGRFLRRRTRHRLGDLHGSIAPLAASDLRLGRIGEFSDDHEIWHLSSRSCVFLDIETTSLGGGVGVAVFLTGIAYFTDAHLCVDQYFMRDFDEEAALLLELAEVLRQFEGMVTFFGKNFDRHRLLTRFRLHGIRDPFPAAHLDLCHVGRRLWSRSLPDFRLRTAERALLGLDRVDDLPGSEAPEAYFSYLRGVGIERLEQVFKHNLLDVLSLVTLLARLDRTLAAPQTAAEWLAVARSAERRGDHAGSEAGCRRGLECCRGEADRGVRLDLLRERAISLRRLGRAEQALEVCAEWGRLDLTGTEPLITAAKLLEHALGSPEAALEKALAARERMARMARAAGLTGEAGNGLDRREIGRRIERLQRRCQRPSRRPRRGSGSGSQAPAARTRTRPSTQASRPSQ